MADWGIKISKPGIDVGTATDPNDLIMSSSINTLKTYTSQNIPPNGAAITHNLGYVPLHLYIGFLNSKPLYTGLVGQNTADNNTNVMAGTSTITNNSNDTYASDALVYVFYESLT